jgi:predicted acetyltransferase
MSLSFKWVGREAADVVGQTRARCYAPEMRQAGEYCERFAKDGRITGDDVLVAERDGEPVGTATSYAMTMWVRAQAFPCQGVAWVGTVKTQRRSGGVASEIMRRTLDQARDRGQVLSALMPFRASFYEHFGYGLVERRATWTIPLSVLPKGPVEAFRFLSGADEARRACRQRMVEAGQCDIERVPGSWDHWTVQEGNGYVVGDQSAGQPMRSWFGWTQTKKDGKDVLTVDDLAYDSIESLRRALCFFATLKDQYWAVTLTLPADLQVNRLLTETQVPHRLVNHETADVRTYTRMQVRVLDPVRLVGGMRLLAEVRGRVVVAIRETEGTTTTLEIEFSGGRASATPSTRPPDVECADRDWAAIVLGDLSASRAANLGLLKVNAPGAVTLLDAFAVGPAPFSTEYF